MMLSEAIRKPLASLELLQKSLKYLAPVLRNNSLLFYTVDAGHGVWKTAKDEFRSMEKCTDGGQRDRKYLNVSKVN